MKETDTSNNLKLTVKAQDYFSWVVPSDIHNRYEDPLELIKQLEQFRYNLGYSLNTKEESLAQFATSTYLSQEIMDYLISHSKSDYKKEVFDAWIKEIKMRSIRVQAVEKICSSLALESPTTQLLVAKNLIEYLPSTIDAMYGPADRGYTRNKYKDMSEPKRLLAFEAKLNFHISSLTDKKELENALILKHIITTLPHFKETLCPEKIYSVSEYEGLSEQKRLEIFQRAHDMYVALSSRYYIDESSFAPESLLPLDEIDYSILYPELKSKGSTNASLSYRLALVNLRAPVPLVKVDYKKACQDLKTITKELSSLAQEKINTYTSLFHSTTATSYSNSENINHRLIQILPFLYSKNVINSFTPQEQEEYKDLLRNALELIPGEIEHLSSEMISLLFKEEKDFYKLIQNVKDKTLRISKVIHCINPSWSVPDEVKKSLTLMSVRDDCAIDSSLLDKSTLESMNYGPVNKKNKFAIEAVKLKGLHKDAEFLKKLSKESKSFFTDVFFRYKSNLSNAELCEIALSFEGYYLDEKMIQKIVPCQVKNLEIIKKCFYHSPRFAKDENIKEILLNQPNFWQDMAKDMLQSYQFPPTTPTRPKSDKISHVMTMYIYDLISWSRQNPDIKDMIIINDLSVSKLISSFNEACEKGNSQRNIFINTLLSTPIEQKVEQKKLTPKK